MKLTVLIENKTLDECNSLTAEHGLSIFISYNEQCILFDTGATGSCIDNAEKLGLKIEDVDTVVISHHHFDHGGGLSRFLEANSKATVYMRPLSGKQYRFRAFGVLNKYAGLDVKLFEKYPGRFVFVNESAEVKPGVCIVTRIQKTHSLPKGNRYLFAETGDNRELDDFEHELIRVIREDDGLTVFTGCSHSGISNMIDTVVKRYPGVPIKAVLGGFHLIGLPVLNTMAGSRKAVTKLAKDILNFPVDRFYTGHCTGEKAYRVLKETMGDKLQYLPTGSSIQVLYQ